MLSQPIAQQSSLQALNQAQNIGERQDKYIRAKVVSVRQEKGNNRVHYVRTLNTILCRILTSVCVLKGVLRTNALISKPNNVKNKKILSNLKTKKKDHN